MIIRKFLIAGGNSTMFIWDCQISKRNIISKRYLKEVEQVGFISNNKLTMMGKELCINAKLAFVFISGKKQISFKLDYKKKENIILLKGIGYILFDKNKKISKKFLKQFCKKYKLPAFGAIVYKKNKIIPYVYVKKIDSFVKETACGSGSLAFSIFSGYERIIQPTGKIINIKIKKDKAIINAEVREVKEK